MRTCATVTGMPTTRSGSGCDRRHEEERQREHDAQVEAVDDALGDDGARRRGQRDRPPRWLALARARADHVRPDDLADAERQEQDRREADARDREQALLGDLGDRAQEKPPAHAAEPGDTPSETHSTPAPSTAGRAAKSPPSGTSFSPPLWTVKTMPQRDEERRGELAGVAPQEAPRAMPTCDP